MWGTEYEGAHVPSVARQLMNRADIGRFVGVRVEGEVFGDLPDKDLQAAAC